MRIRCSAFLILINLLCLTTVSWGDPAPFTGRRVNPNGVPISGEPVSSADQPGPAVPAGVAQGTPEAQASWENYSALVAKLEGYLAAKDYEKAAIASRYIKRVAPGMQLQMKSGGIDAADIQRLEQRVTEADRQMTGLGAQRLVETAKGYNGFSTRSGPGGGNVACAWLVSIILRATGLVPAGWNDNVANDLVARLVREFGWAKIPSDGREYSGSVSSSRMLPGDIVFWSPSEHVGVYLGEGMVLSNSSGRARGAIHPVSGYYDGWIPRFVVRPPMS